MVGVLPLGRPTFDVPYAGERLALMLDALRRAGFELCGPQELLFDAAATRSAISELQAARPGQILVLQVTFTDAAMVAEVSRAFDQPLSIWAIPEPRTGGRLRLNSFCGLNLAGHALGLAGREFGWLYASPDAPGTGTALGQLLGGKRVTRPVGLEAAQPASGRRSIISGARLARIGSPPDGFDTCRHDPAQLAALAGVEVDTIELPHLFASAGHVDDDRAASLRVEASQIAGDLGMVDQPQLDRSLRLKAALDAIKAQRGYDALAIRCWPETFTEYGGAVCGPVSMMGEARTPCACEADVHGALSSLLLQRVADAPVFLTDLVDVDVADDSAVVWHCGQAPASMASPATHPRATIHTNRRMPLLFEFALKPGRVTFFRISRARGRLCAVIGGGEMLDRPMSFTGTSGVVRFDSGGQAALDTIINGALEHHLALAYGDHIEGLKAAAADLGLPILRL
ncbi:MAG: hypothetical protein WBF87_00175 [Mesorhizobium sp.]